MGLIFDPILGKLRKSDVDAAVAAVAAINPVQGRGDATGINNYSVTLNTDITALVSNGVYIVKFANVNTGSSTLNVNEIGATPIKKLVNVDVANGDINAGKVYELIFDGTNFQINVD